MSSNMAIWTAFSYKCNKSILRPFVFKAFIWSDILESSKIDIVWIGS